MLELSEIELRFLEFIGIEKEGNVFRDTENNRIFLFAGNDKQYSEYKKRLTKAAVAYGSGSRSLVLMRKYEYNDSSVIRETRVIRAVNGDLWYNLEIDNRGVCTLSVEPVKTPIELPKAKSSEKPMIKPFGVPPVDPFKTPKTNYYWLNNSNSISFDIRDVDAISFYVKVPSVCIKCDSRKINVVGRDEDEFSYQNLLTTLNTYVCKSENPNTGDALNNVVPFMYRVVVPLMIVQRIIDDRSIMTDCIRHGYDQCKECSDCDEIRRQMANLQQIYAEFMIFGDAKTDKCKCIGSQRG